MLYKWVTDNGWRREEAPMEPIFFV